MSEKEQVEAIKLLREWWERNRGSAEHADLMKRTDQFLHFQKETQPESHGQRRR